MRVRCVAFGGPHVCGEGARLSATRIVDAVCDRLRRSGQISVLRRQQLHAPNAQVTDRHFRAGVQAVFYRQTALLGVRIPQLVTAVDQVQRTGGNLGNQLHDVGKYGRPALRRSCREIRLRRAVTVVQRVEQLSSHTAVVGAEPGAHNGLFIERVGKAQPRIGVDVGRRDGAGLIERRVVVLGLRVEALLPTHARAQSQIPAELPIVLHVGAEVRGVKIAPRSTEGLFVAGVVSPGRGAEVQSKRRKRRVRVSSVRVPQFVGHIAPSGPVRAHRNALRTDLKAEVVGQLRAAFADQTVIRVGLPHRGSRNVDSEFSGG